MNLLPFAQHSCLLTFSCERVNCHTPLFTVSRTPRRQSSWPARSGAPQASGLICCLCSGRPAPRSHQAFGHVSPQVGACIVNAENKIVGIGYNGMPNGCSDDLLPWRRTAENILDTKYPYGRARCVFCPARGMASVRAYIPGMARKHRLPFQLRKQILLN